MSLWPSTANANQQMKPSKALTLQFAERMQNEKECFAFKVLKHTKKAKLEEH